jgi:hypothetical protein
MPGKRITRQQEQWYMSLRKSDVVYWIWTAQLKDN